MHVNAIFGLAKAKTFYEAHPTMPDANVEITPTKDGVHVQYHLHVYDAVQLHDAHTGLGSPEWTVSLTGTAATAMVDGCQVTLYFNTISDPDENPTAQGLLIRYGLIEPKRLAVVK